MRVLQTSHKCCFQPTQQRCNLPLLHQKQPVRNTQICKAYDANTQDILVGGFLVAALAGALYNGLKKEPKICDLCSGNGGIKCFACDGSGKWDSVSSQNPPKDPFGRSANLRECRACKGSGLILCKQCSGTGYTNRM
eukprot:TRINITY_DN1023_c0_g1_i1.p3 TRINITY_DN1023_c0_g1~~TRINITY_DN1023_c0_g1_i1.p3  ORF type:complete len:145 (-),score=13.96 TRINITY_DN1023_c0_g1_i1:286-696(-)